MINFMIKFGSKALIALKKKHVFHDLLINDKFYDKIWEQGTHCLKIYHSGEILGANLGATHSLP
jgi:hypothetical protein